MTSAPLGMADAILAARAGDAARAFLGVNQLAGAAGADRNAQPPQHSDHAVIGGIERRLARHQHLGHEPEHQRRAPQPAEHSHAQRRHEPDAVDVLQQVARAAEPGTENPRWFRN